MKRRIDIYRWLGLGPNAQSTEVDERCQELLRWLKGKDIPDGLRPWAQQQAALVEEFYESFSAQEEAIDRGETPSVTLTEPSSTWGNLLRGPIGLAALGIVAGAVVLGGILWGTGRIGGTESQPTATPAASENPVMAQVLQEIQRLTAIVEKDPNNADAIFQLGEIYIQSGQWEQTITWFNRFLKLNPNNAHALTDIGIAHLELGRFDESEKSLLKAVEADPSYVDAHYTLGFLYTVSPNADEATARKHWERVVELAPGTDRAQIAQLHLDQLSQE